MEQVLFYIIAAISILAALGVVIFSHPIYSAFCLIVNMLLMAVLFAMLHAHFLAAAQVIVYAGAIMVLVVFVIMLLSLQGQERHPLSWGMGIVAGFAAVVFLSLLLPHLSTELAPPDILNVSPAVGDVRSIGLLLYSKYVLPFEVSSILLVAAVAGAVLLAKKRKIGNARTTA